MSADLHIHICQNKKDEEIAEKYVKHTFSRFEKDKVLFGYNTFKINGRWINEQDWDGEGEIEQIERVIIPELTKEGRDRIELKTPNIWVGEVSWMKASLFGDTETYIPDTIFKISELISNYKLTEVTDNLINQIKEAFQLPNNTIKNDGVWEGGGYRVSSPEPVIDFLEEHKGKKAFTISW